MFTGIVESIGTVESVTELDQARSLVIAATDVAPRLTLGASVALDGVCQTVTHLDATTFTVHAIAETLRVTTLGRLGTGSRVNLETPLAAGAPLGGHFVQGHVDGTGQIAALEPWGDSTRLRVRAPSELVRQLVAKGSVAVDGISLTVGPQIGAEEFEVFLIPHTLEHTTLGTKAVGEPVNLETDILGKYLLRYLQLGVGAPDPGPPSGGGQ